MKAKKVTRNDERRKLADILPLRTPLSIHVQSSNVCNFQCFYCAQSLSNEELKNMDIDRKVMSFEMFTKVAENIKKFPDKIKVINLTGFGEPLINKELPDMIRYAKELDIAERTEIVTNGYLLTPQMSDKLINAGLDVLRISIQGLSSKKYKEVSNVSIDMKQFIENIRYFYNKRGSCKMYIKILDSSFDEEETPEQFHKMFEDICDSIAIEHLVPVMSGVDYSKIESEFNTGMQGYKNESIQVCPRPFYMLLVNVDGTVRPCCNYDPPDVLGNIGQTSLVQMWNGEKMKQFRLMQLYKKKNSNTVCNGCPTPIYGLHAEDNIDEYNEKLLEYYE